MLLLCFRMSMLHLCYYYVHVLVLAAYSRISDVDTGTFKYFIKVVPTEYQGRSGVTTTCHVACMSLCLVWILPQCRQINFEKYCNTL